MMTGEELEKRMDELTREHEQAHSEQIKAELKELNKEKKRLR
jgi:hypothetical protein